jgi:UDP-N-acetylglucosamine 4,6-dehydratase
MRVVDLATAIAPGVPIDIIGIRPGEKLHEILLTTDESRHTLDANNIYVVVPDHPFWTPDRKPAVGIPVSDGFAYTSDTNEWWLGPEELKVMLS